MCLFRKLKDMLPVDLVDSLHKLSSLVLGSAVIFGMEAEDI